MAFCNCGDGQQNLGVLSCFDAFESVKKHIRVNTFDSQGVRNSIPLSILNANDGKLSDQYILDQLTHDDLSKRWFITPNTYENVEPSRTDSTKETMSSGIDFLIDTGVKVFQGIIPKTAGVLAQRMNSGACSRFGNYEIDTSGSIKGEMSSDGSKLYPIEVSQGSFEAVEIDPIEGSQVQRLQITFQYAKTVNEGQLRIIASEDIEVSLLSVNGTLDGDLAETGSATITTFSVLFGIDSPGKFGKVIPLEGQEDPANWEVIDSGNNVIVPSGIVTIGDLGQYDFTTPTMEVGDATVEFKGVPLSALDQSYDSNVLTFEVSA